MRQLKKPLENSVVGSVLLYGVIDSIVSGEAKRARGEFPPPYKEGAAGNLMSEGGIWMPGGWTVEDIDGVVPMPPMLNEHVPGEKPKPHRYHPDWTGRLDADLFEAQLFEALKHDGVTTLWPSGVEHSLTLPNREPVDLMNHVWHVKKATNQRKDKQERASYRAADWVNSHFPRAASNRTMMFHGSQKPSTRSKFTTAYGFLMSEQYLAKEEFIKEHGYKNSGAKDFERRVRVARQPIIDNHGVYVAPSLLFATHATSYGISDTNIIRVLGLDAVGEFGLITTHTIPDERRLISEYARERGIKRFEEGVVGSDGTHVKFIQLATYGKVRRPGSRPKDRPPRYESLSPHKARFDLQTVLEESYDRYGIDLKLR